MVNQSHDPIRPQSTESAGDHFPSLEMGQNRMVFSANQPLDVVREEISAHIFSAYHSVGTLDFRKMRNETVSALRIASQLPNPHDSIVAETNLLVAYAMIFRGNGPPWQGSSMRVAQDYVAKALDAYKANPWPDETFEVRCELLHHKASPVPITSYSVAGLEQIDFVSWLLKLDTPNPVAASQIVVMALEEAQTKHLERIDTLSFPIMKSTLEFVQRHPGVAKPLLIQSYALYGYTLGMAFNSDDPSISPQRRESAMTEGIGFIERAISLHNREFDDSRLYGILQSRLLSLQLNSQPPELRAAEDTFNAFNEWMNSVTYPVTIELLVSWVNLSSEYLHARVREEANHAPEEDRDHLSRQASLAYIAILERALVIAERLRDESSLKEAVDQIREKCISYLLDERLYEKALSYCAPLTTTEARFLTPNEETFLNHHYTALANTGHYDEAKHLAEILMRDLSAKDPANIREARNVESIIHFASQMMEADPVWAANRLASAIPHIHALPTSSLASAIRILSRLSHISGRNENAAQWLALYDEKMDAFVQRLTELTESDSTIEFSVEGIYEDEDGLHRQMSASETLVRLMVLLNTPHVDIEKVEPLMIHVRSARDEPSFVRDTDPRLISECFGLDARFHFLAEEYDESERLYLEGLTHLDLSEASQRFFAANLYQGLGLTLAAKGYLEESNTALLKAVSIYEQFPSPNIYYLQGCAKLMENYATMKNSAQATHFHSEYNQIRITLEGAPNLPAFIPEAQTTPIDEF